MKYIYKDKIERIFYYSLIPITIIGIIYIIHRDPQIRLKNEPNCLTITIYKDFFRDADGGHWIEYNFNVNNKIYKGSALLNENNKKKIKDVMQVIYICDDPEVNELVFDEK
jgi:hypothetical protein